MIIVLTGLYAYKDNSYWFPMLSEEDMSSDRRIKRVLKNFLKTYRNNIDYCAPEWQK